MDFSEKPFSSSSDPSTPPPEYKMVSSGNSGSSGQILLPSTGKNSHPRVPRSALQEIGMKTAPRTPCQLHNSSVNTSASTSVEIRSRLQTKEGLSKQCKENLCIVGTVILVLCLLGGFAALFILYRRSNELENRPKFYEEKNYKGGFYVAPPNWDKTGCINLPEWINDKTMSIRVGYHCLDIYEDESCTLGKKRNYEKIFEGSFSHDDLDKIQMGKKITSFKVCP